MNKIIAVILLMVSVTLTQPNRHQFSLEGKRVYDLVYSEIIYLPNDTSVTAYLAYKIPYNRLVFEKTGELYKAGYRFAVEVFDSSGFADRQLTEGEIIVNKYNETDSRDIFREGFLKFNLKEGEYDYIPLFTDLKTNREIRLNPGKIKINNLQNFYKPLIVHAMKGDKECENFLVNFSGSIPFDNNTYEIFIPVKSSSDWFTVSLDMNGRKISEDKIEKEFINSAKLENCDNRISLEYTKDSDNLSFIRIEGLKEVTEGELLISIYDADYNLLYSDSVEVKWFNKPRTLANRETALDLLKLIDEDMSYKYIDDSDEKFDSLLYSYWKRYDPTPASPFNELMNEFYSRADYAAVNYRSFNGKSGLESDRGKIYIKYGKPVRIDRTSNDKGKMIEIWIYNNRVFNFIDEKGTGEFILLDS
jgi:GWxTD domain-containing protein